MPANPVRPLPQLGELEQVVLEHVWQAGDTDVAAVHAAVSKKRAITLNTVGSALERLHRKGLVSRWKVSHAYRYRATLDRDAYQARKLLDAAGGVRGLAEAGLLSAFVDLIADTDAEALERLERLIEKKRQARKESSD